MAITLQQRDQILKVTAGLFNGAPGGAILSDFAAAVNAGVSIPELAEILAATTEFKQGVMGGRVTAEQQAAVLMNNFGVVPDGVAGSAASQAQAFFTDSINDGVNLGSIVYTAVVFLENTTSAEFAPYKALLENKALVAAVHAENVTNIGSVAEGQAAFVGVTSNGPSTPEAALQLLENNGILTPDAGQPTVFTLTQRADNLIGNDADNVFIAPVTQGETGTGALANTFETGDVLDGGGGRNILQADLIGTGTIQDAVDSAPISATTTNIQEVFLRAQRPNADNTIDAEKMAGVEQWWTNNSRSNIQIEDIRTDTSATTFGMRLTDPGVGYAAYFNALFLEGDLSATSAMTLNIFEGPQGAPNAVTQLANITVREITFTVAGEQVVLDTPAIRAADTWNELETALNAALNAIPGAESITLINRGNGQFVFEDSEGRDFQVNQGEALVLSVTNNITVTNSLAVGREEVTGPVISNAVLDGAGNGSQGGALNIGAMSGLRGVEELNISVDRDSHLTSVTSFNQTPGQFNLLRNGEANEFLEVVNLTSIGAEGDLAIGRTTANLDGRVATWGVTAGVAVGAIGGNAVNSGFINLREFNPAGFNGALNVAFTLDNNAIGRYLDPASDVVTFSYNGGDQNDIFNIADLSTGGAVSSDQDFAMEVNMGAGDDRLIINVPTVRQVTVDGGAGENSIVVSQSHGTTAANTFKTFANFQTYEVEGNVANTQHNFASMAGVENVIVATTGGVNTQLRNLETAQNVTVSGKNQTIGNNSTADQLFGTIELRNDAGINRTVTLDNTARLSNSTNGVRQDGVLTVNQLLISQVAGTSATRELTIDSAGERSVANAIADLTAARVNTLKLTGTQDLTVNVTSIANTPGSAININAAALTGNLYLALDGTQLNRITGTGNDVIAGTAGSNDVLGFHGAFAAGSNPTVTGFETVQLGSVDTTMFGDLATGNLEASGTLNTANIGTNNYVIANMVGGGVVLNNLSSGTSVAIGDAARDAAGNRVLSQIHIEQIDLVSSAANAAGTVAELNIARLDVIASGTVSNIAIGDAAAGVAANVGGFRTINLDVARDADLLAGVGDVNNITLQVGSQARTLNITGGEAGRSNIASQLAQSEIQVIDFGAGPSANAVGDTFTIGGVTVTYTNANSTTAQTLADAVVALTGSTLGGAVTALPAPAVLGNTLVVSFFAADGNVNDNILNVVDAGATLAAPPTITTTQDGRAAAVTQVADILDLTAGGANELANSLETIDLSGYNGQVTLAMQQGALGANQSDVNFVLSGFNANITLNDGGGAFANITHNSTFTFTDAGTTQVPTQWTISNIVNTVNLDNSTVFNLSQQALGVSQFADLDVLYVNDGDVTVDLFGNTLAVGSAVIRSEAQGNSGAETWEIIVDAADGAALTGVNALNIGNFNFIA